MKIQAIKVNQNANNMKKLLISIPFIALCAGCLSTKTTETATPTKGSDGILYTNWSKVTTAKNQDPLKDKALRITEKSVGIKFQVFPGPAGTSSSLSPLNLLFGMEKMTYVSFPVYAGVSTGYTPPMSYAASGFGSLWNDSDVENLATASGLIPGTNAYYATPENPVNILQPTTGTVVTPTTTVNSGTNTVTTTTTK